MPEPDTPVNTVSRRFGTVSLGGQVGYLLRKESRVANLVVDDEVTVRAGLRVHASEAFAIDATVAAATAAGAMFSDENRNQLEIPNVFAGLLAVIVIGLVVEGLVFRSIERATVRRWGMQR